MFKNNNNMFKNGLLTCLNQVTNGSQNVNDAATRLNTGRENTMLIISSDFGHQLTDNLKYLLTGPTLNKPGGCSALKVAKEDQAFEFWPLLLCKHRPDKLRSQFDTWGILPGSVYWLPHPSTRTSTIHSLSCYVSFCSSL